jgi:hypothetical protein
LLTEGPHPKDQTHHPGSETECVAKVTGQVGYQHVKARVDHDLIEQKELDRMAKGPEVPDRFHRLISFLIDGSGDLLVGLNPINLNHDYRPAAAR